MKKRILTAALTIALSLTTVCSAKAATTIDVHYNDWDMPITGYLKDGTTYVPIRQFFQLLDSVRKSGKHLQRFPVNHIGKLWLMSRFVHELNHA